MIVCDKDCIGMESTSSFLSCDKSKFSLGDETFGDRTYYSRIPLEDMSLGRYWMFRESL